MPMPPMIEKIEPAINKNQLMTSSTIMTTILQSSCIP